MNRDRCAALVKEHLSANALVVCAMGSTSRAWRAQRAPQPAYFVSDPMGMALPMSLGLALAQPQRNVVLLQGDGDFAMSLSALLTIAGVEVPNLKVIVFHSGRYESGGGQPLPGAQHYSFQTIAQAAGLKWTGEAAVEPAADARIAELLGTAGPGLLVLHVESEPSPYPPAGPLAKSEERAMFMGSVLGDPNGATRKGGH